MINFYVVLGLYLKIGYFNKARAWLAVDVKASGDGKGSEGKGKVVEDLLLESTEATVV